MEDELLDFNNNESEDPPKKKSRRKNPPVNIRGIQKIVLHKFRQFEDPKLQYQIGQ